MLKPFAATERVTPNPKSRRKNGGNRGKEKNLWTGSGAFDPIERPIFFRVSIPDCDVYVAKLLLSSSGSSYVPQPFSISSAAADKACAADWLTSSYPRTSQTCCIKFHRSESSATAATSISTSKQKQQQEPEPEPKQEEGNDERNKT